MYSLVLSSGFVAAGVVAHSMYHIKARHINLYKSLPEYPLMDLKEILTHPTPDMISKAVTIWSPEHKQHVLSVPQVAQCTVTGLSSGILHQLLPSVAALQRQKNAQARIAQRERLEQQRPGSLANSPVTRYGDKGKPQSIEEQALRQREEEYLTGWEDESVQLDKSVPMEVITEPVILSNIIDTKVYDTLVERSAEQRDARGNIAQDAQYALRREEKPHDEQSMGEFLRLVDPIDGQFFCPQTHRYEAPWEFVRWKELEAKRGNKERAGELGKEDEKEFEQTQRNLMKRMISGGDSFGDFQEPRNGSHSTSIVGPDSLEYETLETILDRPLAPFQIMKLTPEQMLEYRANMRLLKEKEVHLPKEGSQYPEVFVTLKRHQIPESMFLPHTTHLSLSPNSELDQILKEGNLWAKVGQERLVGLKREEKAVLPLKHVTILGEIYRDFDESIRLRGIWDHETNTYVDPVVTYNTRWEHCHELETEANKYWWAGTGCFALGGAFAFNAALTITRSLSAMD